MKRQKRIRDALFVTLGIVAIGYLLFAALLGTIYLIATHGWE